jgi:uncharacterized membrane protein
MSKKTIITICGCLTMIVPLIGLFIVIEKPLLFVVGAVTIYIARTATKKKVDIRKV